MPDRYRTPPIVAIVLTLSGCFGIERDPGGDPTTRSWILQTLDGVPFDARATLEFPNEGRIAGSAPCNRYSATMESALPDFNAGPILATRRSCPDLALETAYFKALDAMERAQGDAARLTLIGPDGREMVFTAAD